MKIGKFKHLLSCVMLMSGLLCFASCDNGMEGAGVMEEGPLNMVIWDENMTEVVHEVQSPTRSSPQTDRTTLSLDTTYILEIYIYSESSDPNHNYTDIEISYGMVALEYDNNYVQIQKKDSNNRETQEKLYYYLNGVCETTNTYMGAEIEGDSVGANRPGVGVVFDNGIYLSFE